MAPKHSKRSRGRAGSVWGRLYRGETSVDFVGRWRRWAAISGVVILVGLASLGIRGLNFGIEFVGGTAWQVQSPTLAVATVRSAISPLGLSSATIESLGSGSHRTIEIQDRLVGTGAGSAAIKAKVTSKLAAAAKVNPSAVSISDVGPTWGSSITMRALEALVGFFVAISAYIAFRFEWKMAAAALVAVVHDLLVTVGIYALSGLQVTPATVVAVLTILGYSLYDTIVVFDRVMENAKTLMSHGRMTYSEMVDLSVNQVLMRSLNTSIVAILPILSVLLIGAQLLGATTLEQFGLALFIGLTTGAYSSLFVASPVLAAMKEREPRYRLLAEKLAAKGHVRAILTPAAFAAGGGVPKRPTPVPSPAEAKDGSGSDTPDQPSTSRPEARPVPGWDPSHPPLTSKRAAPQSRGAKRRR